MRIRRAFVRYAISGSIFLAGIVSADWAYGESAQESAEIADQIDRLMAAGPGQKAGELQKKEILRAALKREKIDSDSVRLALQSMSELFDFRLSRAGDRYVYELGNGRRLVMLRYERGKRVYEARLTEANNFEARVIDVSEGLPESGRGASIDAFGDDGDGEIDVERQAMLGMVAQAGKVKAPEGTHDAALSERPSPDIAFPDRELEQNEENVAQGAANANRSKNAGVPSERGFDAADGDFPKGDALKEYDERRSDAYRNGKDADAMGNDALRALSNSKMNLPLDDEADMRNGVGSSKTAEAHVNPRSAIGRRQTVVDAHENTQSIQLKCKSDDKTQSVISIIMLVVGLLTFAIGFVMSTLPSIRMRRRVRRMGLEIVDRLWISRSQQLLHVRWNDREFVIIAVPEKVQCLIASERACDLFTFLRAKSYWNGMADLPLTDRQLASLLAAFKTKSALKATDHDFSPTTNDKTAQGFETSAETTQDFEASMKPPDDGTQDETVQGLDNDYLDEYVDDAAIEESDKSDKSGASMEEKEDKP